MFLLFVLMAVLMQLCITLIACYLIDFSGINCSEESGPLHLAAGEKTLRCEKPGSLD